MCVQTENGELVEADTWTTAYWPDGSIKWAGMAAVIPGNTRSVKVIPSSKKKKTTNTEEIHVTESEDQLTIATGKLLLLFLNLELVFSTVFCMEM